MDNPYAAPSAAPVAPSTQSQNRWPVPRLLLELTGALALMNTVGLVLVLTLDHDPFVPLTALMSLVSYGVYWKFLKGRNWARILIYGGALLGVISMMFFTETDGPRQLFMAVDLPLNVFLLYWLTTKPVRGYFGVFKNGEGGPANQ